MPAMSKMHEMLMETLKCHVEGILVNKATRKRLGEKSPELTLEETSIKRDWIENNSLCLLAELGAVFGGGKLFYFPLVPLCTFCAPCCQHQNLPG